ncbi:DnaJ C-terminal domain-containing protein [Sedimenticola selenatireducens]|uniref:DnaJ C-terminal domain-containing protein n=1 Tax=Sedimenticola selenatireducens TaxID=191960 RepID=UPI002AAB784C|nr:DnaJ C-terminal domain-containing protein [Sedimenticola selenatireducens]
MQYKDYYAVMGVNKDSTQDEIKRAYRRLARKYHPDVSKEENAEARFKEVGEAYEVLKDPEKRAAYDQLGANWKAGEDFRPPPDWDAGFEFSGGGFTEGDASEYSDFFESLFGQGFGSTFHSTRRSSGFHAPGQDHHAKVLIDLEDAFHGATRTITLHAPELDSRGHVVTRERTLNVRIPKGVRQGQQIRLAGQGTAGIGQGAAGDLYLEIEFKPHSLYRVDGRDLYIDLPVSPWEAALGAKVKLPTPAGVIDLTVPAGSGSGRKLRLKGRGIPGGNPGDLYAILQIALPPADNEKANALYRKMAQELAFNPRAGLGV